MIRTELTARPRVARMLQLAFTNPLQRKRIERFLAGQDEAYWEFAEDLLAQLSHSFLQDSEDWASAARCYNDLCLECVRQQILFRKTGVYPQTAQAGAFEDVYNRPEVMRVYMVGLLLTYLFWPNQYQMFRLFKDHLTERPVRSYLEVGVGHGLFAAEAMRTFPDLAPDLIDISATSIELARAIMRSFGLDVSRARFTLGDFFRSTLPERDGYDLIVMGEILEHVENPDAFLKRAGELLAPGGTYYVTTCVNCPARDHVYHFHTVAEIQDMIRCCGLEIGTELVLPAEEVPLCRCEKERITINYAALLTRPD